MHAQAETAETLRRGEYPWWDITDIIRPYIHDENATVRDETKEQEVTFKSIVYCI